MSKCTAECSNLKRCKTKSGEMFILLDIFFCLNSTCLFVGSGAGEGNCTCSLGEEAATCSGERCCRPACQSSCRGQWADGQEGIKDDLEKRGYSVL